MPQQHRLVSIAPPIAPIVLGLNNSATFPGTTAAGIIGAAGVDVLGGHELRYVAATLVAVSELAAREIAAIKPECNAAADRRAATEKGSKERLP